MAVVLNTTLKMDGKVYEEGSEASSLPSKVKKFAKDNDLLVAVVDPDEVDELEEEEESEEEEEKTEEPEKK